MSIKFVRYKHSKDTMEPDANGEWVKWNDFQSSRWNIKQMKKDRNDAEKRETLAADRAVEYLQRAEAAEAKLTKAVEALRHTLGKPRSAEQTYAALCSEIMWEIRFVLAELEGELWELSSKQSGMPTKGSCTSHD